MAQKSRSDYTMLNIVSGLGGYVVTFVLGLVCRMAFTRVFSAEYLGINGLFGNVLGMLSLAELGIGSAIVYALYAPLAKKDNKKIATLVSFYGKCYRVIAIVVLTIGLALIPFLDLIIKEKPDIQENYYLIYLIMLFNSVSGYFFAYRSSLLVAAQRNYMITFVSNIVIIVQNAVQIAAIFLFKNYIVYMLIASVCGMLTNIISSEIAKREFPCIKTKKPAPLEKEEKRSLVRNVRALTINKIGGLLVNSTDNIITTFFDGLATTGLASNYTLLSTSINSLLNIVFNSLNASVGNHNALETKENKLALFNSINLANFWLYGWASIGIFVVSGDVVSVMFGENYVLPFEIPLIIAINFYMVGMQNAVWTYYNTQGLFIHGRYVSVITAAINIVLSIILGKFFGLFGILLATAVARLLTNTWYSPYAVFKYGFGMPARTYFIRYIRYALLLVFTGGVCYFICSFVSILPIVDILIEFAVCCIVPNLIFLLCFFKSEEFVILKKFAMSFLGKFVKLIKR